MEAGSGLLEGTSFLLAGGGGSVFFGEYSFLAGVESAETYELQLLKVDYESVSASQMNLSAGESSKFTDHMHANHLSLLVVFLVKASRNTHTTSKIPPRRRFLPCILSTGMYGGNHVLA